MKVKLACILALILSFFVVACEGQPRIEEKQEKKVPSRTEKFLSMLKAPQCERKPYRSLHAIKKMLNQSDVGMSPVVISKVMTTLRCAQATQTPHNHILTVIDYSKPSSEKRLWVFDLRENRMLFHTYVSHGITSGTLLTKQFSNKYNSKASSLGVYRTDQSYYGRHGLSLRLTGLEQGFNDHASGRAIVMHSAWYVNEDFINKYGRPGRSWGCPAISREMKKPLINAIKENALLVVYYPGEQWVRHSKYLNCRNFSALQQVDLQETALKEPTEPRADILFVEKNKNNKREESEPIMVMSADNYSKTFHARAPLLRMLRCQINDSEYIALSNTEFETIANSGQKDAFKDVFFVIPEVKNIRGYYKTEMKFVHLGQIQTVDMHPDSKRYTVTFDKSPPAQLKTTHRFIRWLGL